MAAGPNACSKGRDAAVRTGSEASRPTFGSQCVAWHPARLVRLPTYDATGIRVVQTCDSRTSSFGSARTTLIVSKLTVMIRQNRSKG